MKYKIKNSPQSFGEIKKLCKPLESSGDQYQIDALLLIEEAIEPYAVKKNSATQEKEMRYVFFQKY